MGLMRVHAAARRHWRAMHECAAAVSDEWQQVCVPPQAAWAAACLCDVTVFCGQQHVRATADGVAAVQVFGVADLHSSSMCARPQPSRAAMRVPQTARAMSAVHTPPPVCVGSSVSGAPTPPPHGKVTSIRAAPLTSFVLLHFYWPMAIGVPILDSMPHTMQS
eukprot:TRINITY_DN3761_c0_g1_i1.p1 TRINITY_DN3761_c0_g1~~TRINITY_DN3761_c0_g1_i1.p1  ORF type:complete len:163 (+),score=20.61 TRINITY_DN3761_c0_g1_i1:64-552(+)